ncbi:hypothetical protein EJB05_25935, partial [Eragrostis curvula]
MHLTVAGCVQYAMRRVVGDADEIRRCLYIQIKSMVIRDAVSEVPEECFPHFSSIAWQMVYHDSLDRCPGVKGRSELQSTPN